MDPKKVFPADRVSEGFFARTQWFWIILVAVLLGLSWLTEIIYGW
jgi:hypothetical protein